MLRFVLDHLKTKMMRKHTVKKLPFKVKYVPIDIRLKKCEVKLL